MDHRRADTDPYFAHLRDIGAKLDDVVDRTTRIEERTAGLPIVAANVTALMLWRARINGGFALFGKIVAALGVLGTLLGAVAEAAHAMGVLPH